MDITEVKELVAVDPATAELFEQQQLQLQRYQTRYVFVPFMETQASQIPNGYVHVGVIHPITAPKRKINYKALPDGAQTLNVVSSSLGIPAALPRISHKDPDVARLMGEIAQMQRQRVEENQEPPNIAIYFDEVMPIVNGITAMYGREGAIEVTSLNGYPVATFEQSSFNDLLFGAEVERPQTARAYRERLSNLTKQLQSKKSDANRMIERVIEEILSSVATCERHCQEHIRTRHLEMDDPKDDTPKRYSRRDLRAIEFIGAIKRNEYLQAMADEQRASMAAFPKVLEIMERREVRNDALFTEIVNTLKSIQASNQPATTKK